MYRRGTCNKARQEGKGSHTSTTISNWTMRSNPGVAISAQSLHAREMSSGRYTRRKCSGVTGKRYYKEC